MTKSARARRHVFGMLSSYLSTGCRRYCALVLFGVASASDVVAQERLVRRFDGEAGLLPPAVALAQDSTGFIWVGTRAGLFRYDGSRFSRWAPADVP